MSLPKRLGPQEAPSIGPDLYNIMIFRWNCMVKHFLQNELLSDDFPVLVLILGVGIRSVNRVDEINAAFVKLEGSLLIPTLFCLFFDNQAITTIWE